MKSKDSKLKMLIKNVCIGAISCVPASIAASDAKYRTSAAASMYATRAA